MHLKNVACLFSCLTMLICTSSNADDESPHGLPVDLTAYYSTPASRFTSNTRFPWSSVPRGRQVMGNVLFDLGGHLCLWGEANAKAGLIFPEKKEGIRIGRKFEAAYLYHAAFYPSEQGTPVARVVLQDETGDGSEIELTYGNHLRDWYRYLDDPAELGDPKSSSVWTGQNPMANDPTWKLHFFVTEIANPHPELEITAIHLYSAKQNSAYCLLGITTGPAGLLACWKSVRKHHKHAGQIAKSVTPQSFAIKVASGRKTKQHTASPACFSHHNCNNCPVSADE